MSRLTLKPADRQEAAPIEEAGILEESWAANRALVSMLACPTSPGNQGNPLRRLGVGRPMGI